MAMENFDRASSNINEKKKRKEFQYWIRLRIFDNNNNNNNNLSRETELLIAAQNNTIRNNYVKAKIDKMQQNSKCRLRGDRDETIYYIISECSKLAQKEYKTRHDWVGKVIHLEVSKKFNFEHTNKWYMYSPESVLENWDAQSSLGFWNTNRSPNLSRTSIQQKQKMRTWRIVNFAVPKDHRVKSNEARKEKNIWTLLEN